MSPTAQLYPFMWTARKAEKQNNEIIKKRTKEIFVGFLGEEKVGELLKDLHCKEKRKQLISIVR